MKGFIIAFASIGIIAGAFFLWQFQSAKVTIAPTISPSQMALFTPTPTPSPAPTISPSPAPQYVDTAVPFTAQAPLGQWNNPVFQDGCEEASILMAMAWVGKASIASPTQASSAISQISDFELEKYGEFRDRSAKDAATLIHDFYEYPYIEFHKNISAEDIITQLQQGNVVIVPVNGQKLENKNFTPPGPERHMLVVRGWDPKTQEFITNDPGTRLGNGYRYKKELFASALRDYKTGYHEAIPNIKKNMIVISRQAL